MPNDSVATVSEQFAAWYADVSFGEDPNRLEQRWKGVCTLVEQADESHVDTLIAIALGGAVSTESLGKIRGYFTDEEGHSDKDCSDRELQILGGSALACALDRDDEIAAYAALAITTANMAGVRVFDLPIDLRAMAHYALTRISEVNRGRLDAGSTLPTLPRISFAEAKAKLEEQPNVTGMSAALEVYATAVNQAFDRLSKEMLAIDKRNNRLLAVQDEELNILWWIVSGYSNDLGKSFRDVPSSAQPLIFAKELADITSSLPGPPSVKGILCRAGLSTSVAITIPKAVNACSSDWLNGVLSRQSDSSALLEPIHLAIYRRLESNDDNSWIEGWAAACNVDPQRVFSIADIGWLFYCECLIPRGNGRD